jgi:hypothetical protein
MENLDFSGAVSSNDLLKALAKPALVDTTIATVVYEGYKHGTRYRICKIDLSTAIISRTWATGAWADRANLTYA